MKLGERFAGWLRTEGDRRGEAAALSATLAESGYLPEARLLMAYGQQGSHTSTLPAGESPGEGRRVHVGPQLPEAAVGELWLDTVELSWMVLLPGDPIEDFAPEARHRWSPQRNWLALRAVTVWHYAGFLAAAGLAARDEGGLRLFDAARLLSGPEKSPVLMATPSECAEYRRWFGKRMVDRSDWVDAARLFGQEAALALWTPGAREWTGGVVDLEVFAAIEPDEIEVDDREAFDTEEEETPGPEARRFFGPYEAPRGGAAFRTTVDPRDGVGRAVVPR